MPAPSITPEVFRCLLAQSRGGDANARWQLLSAFDRRLRRHAKRNLPMALAAKLCPEDCAQETLLRAYKLFAGFDGDRTEDLSNWLDKHLKRVIHKHVQKFATAKRNVGLELPLGELLAVITKVDGRDGKLPEAIIADGEMAAMAKAAMENLSEGQSQVLHLRLYGGLSWKAIGRRMERSKDAVRMLYSRACQELRRRCGGENGGGA